MGSSAVEFWVERATGPLRRATRPPLMVRPARAKKLGRERCREGPSWPFPPEPSPSLRLRQRLLNHFPPHPGDALFQTLVEIREPLVVQAHEVQEGRVQVGDVVALLDGLEA